MLHKSLLPLKLFSKLKKSNYWRLYYLLLFVKQYLIQLLWKDECQALTPWESSSWSYCHLLPLILLSSLTLLMPCMLLVLSWLFLWFWIFFVHLCTSCVHYPRKVWFWFSPISSNTKLTTSILVLSISIRPQPPLVFSNILTAAFCRDMENINFYKSRHFFYLFIINFPTLFTMERF